MRAAGAEASGPAGPLGYARRRPYAPRPASPGSLPDGPPAILQVAAEHQASAAGRGGVRLQNPSAAAVRPPHAGAPAAFVPTHDDRQSKPRCSCFRRLAYALEALVELVLVQSACSAFHQLYPATAGTSAVRDIAALAAGNGVAALILSAKTSPLPFR